MNESRQHPGPPRFRHTAYDVVGVAASAGGLHALSVLAAALPVEFPAAVLVVQHLTPDRPSLMSQILTRVTGLPVKDAEQGELLRPGVIYLAPSDHHMLVSEQGAIRLDHGAEVNFVRPAADLLFRSLAANYRERAIGVVLSGTGKDGSLGVRAIAQAGGLVIAQDEGTAEFFGMPGTAIRTGCVHRIVPLDAIAAALTNAVIAQ